MIRCGSSCGAVGAAGSTWGGGLASGDGEGCGAGAGPLSPPLATSPPRAVAARAPGPLWAGTARAPRPLPPALERPDDRRGAGRRHGDHAWPRRADPAERLPLVDRLPHADETGAAAGRVDDDAGQGEAHLLG